MNATLRPLVTAANAGDRCFDRAMPGNRVPASAGMTAGKGVR